MVHARHDWGGLLVTSFSICPIENGDFTALNSTMVFEPNSMRKAVAIFFQDDDILESREYFFVVLNSSDPGVMVVLGNATVNITDNDGNCGIIVDRCEEL